MKILGISGFDGSMAFKRTHWPGLDEREYRISQGHDSAAALVVDGEIVAAVAEERINRRKHTGDFPAGAMKWCLNHQRLVMADIDQVVHGFDYAPYRSIYGADPVSRERYDAVYSRDALLAQMERHFPGYPRNRVRHVGHHLAHAASAYFTSGWDDCLVVVADGMGELESVSVYEARDGHLRRLGLISARDSIGIFYSLVTLHLGFDFNADEYKIMGLAPYGNPETYRAFFDHAVECSPTGSVRIPLLHINTTRDEREQYLATRDHLSAHLIPARDPAAEITDAHRDVAAGLQACLDRTMLGVCEYWGRATGLKRLAMAGGVALNCTANGQLLRSGAFDAIYVQPAAGDDGTALGAALHAAAAAGEVSNARMPVPFFGPGYSAREVDDALARRGAAITVRDFPAFADLCAETAKLIADGRVVAWYRGQMEFGPRALGHRSVLADPSRPEMRDRINAMVKMREAFRPFAPAVTLETVHEWFEVGAGFELPFMIMTVPVREQHRCALPAITHVDGSARVQTVSANDNGDFHELLRAVGKTTGREMVLNTSFNVKGQAIVNTPDDAIETFLGTGIDYLVIENALVTRA